MASPFPGMDPYLEDPPFWPDFHATFVPVWRELIADRLPDNYEARLDEQLKLIELPNGVSRSIRPDIGVFKHDLPSTPSSDASLATIEPAILTLPSVVEVRDVWIEIYHRPERQLVAVLELLSPSNKHGSGRGQYMLKRNALIMEGVHLVELDLLVAGERLPTQEPLPAGDYYLVISRADRRPKCEVYAWTRNDRLPVVPVPLKPPDPDIFVDLAQVFATAYERGKYGKSIDYSLPQQPEG
ncbi:MAG: DUF4058 family protein [Pirellulales bacterium]